MLFHAYTKEFRYNLRLATPVMVGMLGHTLVSFVDNVMVGQIGTAELAAVSLGNSFIFIAMSIGIGFSTAITPLVAEADTEDNFEKGKSVFKHGVVLCTLLGLLLFLVLLASKPLMHVMNQPEEVVALALPYLDLVALSMVPLIIFQAFKQFSDGLSLTKYPMYATLVANILNVILNYALIFGKFGFPQLGIIGAALGTLIARFAMLFILWWMLSQRNSSKAYVTNIKFRSLYKQPLQKLTALGLPSAMQMFFEVGIFTAAIWLSGILGKNAQAANQIALNLASMTFMVATGLSVTAMIRVGNQKGLKDFAALKRIAQSIFLLGAMFAILFALLFGAFHQLLPQLYVDLDNLADLANSREVVQIAATLLLAAALFQISDSLQVIALGALKGLQDVKIPTIITFISYWVIGFPLSFYLGKAERYGSLGIWIGLLAGLSAAAILLFVRFNYLTNRLILQQQKQ
jgi:MATE family multidrug resistance protein